MNMNEEIKKKYTRIFIVVSIVIPVVVALLFKVKITGFDLSFLPFIYANINGLTALILIAAFWAIKNKKTDTHRNLMLIAMVLSLLFLVMYVAYHMTSESTSFGGEGLIKIVYFVILISHIILSIAVIPMVLFTFLRAITGDFERHRKLAKITMPIWLYVAVTGVVVYIMISPFY